MQTDVAASLAPATWLGIAGHAPSSLIAFDSGMPSSLTCHLQARSEHITSMRPSSLATGIWHLGQKAAHLSPVLLPRRNSMNR